MPAATRYIWDTNSPEHHALEQVYRNELKARLDVHNKNRKFYEGDHPPPLEPDNTGVNDNLVVNAIESVVDKGVSSLLGTDDRGVVRGVEIKVPDDPRPEESNTGLMARVAASARNLLSKPKQIEDSEEQQWIDQVLRANDFDMIMMAALLEGALTGHVFIRIMDDGLIDPETGDEVPRIIPLNSSSCSVFWRRDDKDYVLWYRVEQEFFRQDIIRDGDQWLILELSRNTPHGTWRADALFEWAYPWPPIIEWKNLPNSDHSYYGRSDVKTLINLNVGLNFVMSNFQRILKHHAHPKTIATGAQGNMLEQSAVNGLWTIASEDANVFNLEMQSDLQSSLDFISLLRRFIFDLGREMDPGSVQDKLGDITNFGLRVLAKDALAKSGTRRMLASRGLVQLGRRLLEFGSFDPFRRVVTQWPDPLPRDPVAEAQALTMDREQGLSMETYLHLRGHDPDEEFVRRTAEIDEQVDKMQKTMLPPPAEKSPDEQGGAKAAGVA